ncbi:MAG: hypothetical protein Q9227_005644 [Pyrenula ochraceoflavens]
MARNKRYQPSKEPFRDRDDLQLRDSPTGPFSFLNPTKAKYELSHKGPHHISFSWRSRDNRKGRHTLQVQKKAADDEIVKKTMPARTNTPRAVLKNIGRMFYVFPVWDISYLGAVIFCIGSAIFVVDAFFFWLPEAAPSTEFHNETVVIGGWLGFIGALIFFQVGATLFLFEAINTQHTGCFGWAIESLYDGGSGSQVSQITPAKEACFHHHQNKKNLVGKCSQKTASAVSDLQDQNGKQRSWQWWPSWHDLRTHYIYEVGFLASVIQFAGATIFSISGVTLLPYVYKRIEEPQGLLDGVFWIPTVVGGVGFIVSAYMFMLETQENWRKPNPRVLGWWVGFFDVIGSIGFLLDGSLGLVPKSSYEWAADLCYLLGSWAFFFGTAIQWYESLQKYPVEGDGS